MIKPCNKFNIERTYLNIINTIYDKPIGDIILNSEKLKVSSLRSGKRKGCPLIPLLLNIVLVVVAKAIRKEKEIKCILFGKELKLSLFTDDMILYRENPEDSIIKKLINEYNKVEGYKISIQKSGCFCTLTTKHLQKIKPSHSQ